MAVLSGPPDMTGGRRRAGASPIVRVESGRRVTHRATRFSGTVHEFRDGGVELVGVSGDRRLFKLVDGAFSIDGVTVSLAPQPTARPAGPQRTASGSIAVAPSRARVARLSRIWVEGIHDAELVERVWGDDLRGEGVVVERLDGADVLAERLDAFQPDEDARIGVLLDHLVPGSKESRIADAAMAAHPDGVLVVGTPFIDIWEAVDPRRIGISAWPRIPKGVAWKEGVCATLGLGEPGAVWRQILGSVRTYADLHPSLVGAVESLIDFVAPPPE
jgi:hypothetical protein